MKTTNLRIFATLLVLSVLWSIVPGLQADEATDYINQIYQDQKDRDDYLNSVAERAMQWLDAKYAEPAPTAQPNATVAPRVAAPLAMLPEQEIHPVAFAQMARQN